MNLPERNSRFMGLLRSFTKAGEGPGPSTFAAAANPSPSASRRGEPATFSRPRIHAVREVKHDNDDHQECPR